MVEDNTESEFVSSEEICPGEREIRMFRISEEMFPVGYSLENCFKLREIVQQRAIGALHVFLSRGFLVQLNARLQISVPL